MLLCQHRRSAFVWPQRGARTAACCSSSFPGWSEMLPTPQLPVTEALGWQWVSRESQLPFGCRCCSSRAVPRDKALWKCGQQICVSADGSMVPFRAPMSVAGSCCQGPVLGEIPFHKFLSMSLQTPAPPPLVSAFWPGWLDCCGRWLV